VATPGRRTARSVAARALAPRRARAGRGRPLDGGGRAGQEVGGVDRDALSGQRRLRRARRAHDRPDRPRARPGRYVEPNVWMLHPPGRARAR